MESSTHINLVNIITKYVSSIVPVSNRCLIEVDSSGEKSLVRSINNFIPDVYYSFDELLIIGEAKSENDFLRTHSKNQYDAYIE